MFREDLGGGDAKKSTVRVHAINLRKALAQYYSDEGVYDDLAIMIPTGGYVPIFRWWSTSEGPTSLAPPRGTADVTAIPPSTLRYTLSIDVDAQHIPEILTRLHETLHTAPGQPSLRVDYSGLPSVRPLYIRPGSILLYVECTDEGYRWLANSWQSGALDKAFGYTVTALRPSQETDDALSQNHIKSLEHCVTLPVAMSNADVEEMHLVVHNMSSFDHSTIVTIEILHSLDMKSWRKILSQDLKLPIDHGSFLYRLNFGRFGMPAIIRQPPKVPSKRIGLGHITKRLPTNTYWQTEFQKFQSLYTPRPPFEGGWLRAEAAVKQYDLVSSLSEAHVGVELALGKPQNYTPPSVYEVKGGVRHYTARTERTFVGIALRTEDLSTPKGREVTRGLSAEALLSDFDEFNQTPGSGHNSE